MRKIDLNNKVCVITGAGGVLCSEFAKAVGACGAKVALLDLNEAAAKKVADQINNDGGCAIAIACNVLERASLVEAKKIVGEKFGKVDILINGAGGNNPKGSTAKDIYEAGDIDDESVKSFFDLDGDGIRFVFDLNFLGTLLPTQVFAEDMARNEDGIILNVSSMNAFCPLTRIPAYSGAKAAISNFTQWLAVHFAQTGIRVNAIAPGFFLTEQNRALLTNEDGSYTARSHKILNATPMKRFGVPEDLLGTLLFLLDNEQSAFVTGVVVPVDGGFSAYSGV